MGTVPGDQYKVDHVCSLSGREPAQMNNPKFERALIATLALSHPLHPPIHVPHPPLPSIHIPTHPPNQTDKTRMEVMERERWRDGWMEGGRVRCGVERKKEEEMERTTR